MPVLPKDWRTFVRDQNVLPQRQQSRLFLEREGLGAVPLRGGSKIFDTQGRSLEHWTDVDQPAWQNWASPLQASPTSAWGDLDLDLKPMPGLEWTEELHAQADAHFRNLAAALDRFGPIDAPAFGRLFFHRRGHHIVHVLLQTPEDMDALRRLRMVKAIAIGDLRVCLEVRAAAGNKSDPNKKAFTLPGSVYERPDDGGLDLIAWRTEAGDAKIVPVTLSVLHRALYAFLLTIAALPHWSEGNRHASALYFAGVLAHEVQVGFLTKDEATAVWSFLLERAADPDRKDREKILADSLQAIERGQPVLGYGKIAELVGDEVRTALLRMRGGSDPDAIAELYRRIVAVQHGLNTSDCFVDLWGGASLYAEVPGENMVRRYANRAEFPPLPSKKGPVPIIRVVLNSDRIQRVAGVIQMPGVGYGKRFWRDGEDYVEITDDHPAPADAAVYLNICDGIPAIEEPTPEETVRWKDLWDRHCAHLTDDIEENYEKLEQAIAHKVQDVRLKIPLGIALCGGQGIGKSALFDVILRSLYGSELVAKTAGFDLKEKFRLQTLGGCLFYAIEEIDFHGLDKQMHELFKNLCKNDRIPIEHKYGRKGDDRNVAIPFFVTNSDDPRIIVDGKPERSLIVVQGVTHESKGGSLQSWQDYINSIHEEVAQFAEALKDARIRNAGRHYFATMELKRAVLMGAVVDTPPEHLRHSLDPTEQCLLAMFEENMIRPNKQDWPIDGPFTMRMIAIGLEERMSGRVKPGSLNEMRIHHLLRKLFNGNIVNEKQVVWTDTTNKTKTVRLRYFKHNLAKLHALIKENRGLDLTPIYDLEAPGPAVEPMKEECLLAWEKSMNPIGGGNY